MQLLKQIDPGPTDTIVTLGDYVDRGPNTNGVLNTLIELSTRCRLIPILGNHDEMMMRAESDPKSFQNWLMIGGQVALNSYGPGLQTEAIPIEHFDFLRTCRPYFETETHLFLHANYFPDVPISQTKNHTLRWLSLRDHIPSRAHCSGKIVIVGHTPQSQVLDLDYLIGIDTGCAMGGRLTALDVDTKQSWSSTENDSSS